MGVTHLAGWDVLRSRSAELAKYTAGYVQLVIWATLALMIVLVAQASWAWYGSRRQLAVTSEAGQWRLLRQATLVSAGIGVAILIMGVVLFALTGYNWFVLAVTWPFGLLHTGLTVRRFHRAQKRTGRAGLLR